MLGEIRNYLKQRKSASLEEIAAHLDTNRETAEFALGYWIRKGTIQPAPLSCNHSCNRCIMAEKHYRWSNYSAHP